MLCILPFQRLRIPLGVFRFQNELINLREQHDALEFFNALVDSVDEALKALGESQICNKIFGGTFAGKSTVSSYQVEIGRLGST